MKTELLGSTLRFTLDTYDGSGASVAPTGLSASVIQIYKNGSTERGNSAGYTVTANFGSKNGSHLIEIDTSDNTVVGFWEANADYLIRVTDLTIDGQTPVHVWIKEGKFRLSAKPYVDDLQDLSALEVNAEVDSALIDYDAPTNTELEARTLPSANYFDPSTDAVELLNSGGSAGINVTELVDLIWDEILTGATHNVAGSSGRRIRELASIVILSGTSPNTGGNTNTSTSIELDSSAETFNGSYDPSTIAIVAGTGAGQCRQIFEYNGTTKIAYINRDWKTIPDDTSEYIIYANAGDTHVNEGKAQGGSLSTIILNSLASASNDIYNEQFVFIVAGTGADQCRRISDYVGSTKVATVESDWLIAPDSTSIYAILPSDHDNLKSTEISSIISTLSSTSFGGSTFSVIMNFIVALTTGNIEITDADTSVQTIILKDAGDNTIATFTQPTTGSTKGSRTLA